MDDCLFIKRTKKSYEAVVVNVAVFISFSRETLYIQSGSKFRNAQITKTPIENDEN